MPLRRYLIALGIAAAFASSLIHAAAENAWPNRTVHMVVPNAAGGPTDVNARIVAEQLSKIWGQQVVIDNKAGAGTIVQKISGDLAKALADPALVEKLARNAYTVDNFSGGELAKFLKAEIEKWEVVIKTTGPKID